MKKNLPFLFVLSLSLFPFVMSGQGLINNGASIVLTSGANIYITGTASVGNFVNQDVAGPVYGNITNTAGTITLEGDWTNNSADPTNKVFTSNSGTVVFNGAAQSINGTATTYFNNLTIQGTASSTKTLNVNTTVGGGFGAFGTGTGVLTINSTTVMDLNKKVLTVTNPNPTGIATAGTGSIKSETLPAAGYGEVVWNIGTTASSTYVVPFTSGVAAKDLSLTFATSTNGVGNGSYTLGTYPATTYASNAPLPTSVPNSTNVTSVPTPNVVADRYWFVSPSGYGTVPDLTSLIFTYAAADVLSANNGGSGNLDATNSLMAQRWGVGNTWAGFAAGTNSNVAHTVTVGAVGHANFPSSWTLVQNPNLLPIELVQFTASCNGSKSTIQWSTASESNNDYFTLEKSLDGGDFSDLTTVKGAGNSSSFLNYSTQDPNPVDGVVYYRLKQTDFDGKYHYSAIISVKCGNSNVNNDAVSSSFIVFPNPSNKANDLTISMSGLGSDQKVLVEIVNVLGQIVYSQIIYSNSDGSIRQTLDAGRFLYEGMYTVMGIVNNSVYKQKLVIYH